MLATIEDGWHLGCLAFTCDTANVQPMSDLVAHGANHHCTSKAERLRTTSPSATARGIRAARPAVGFFGQPPGTKSQRASHEDGMPPDRRPGPDHGGAATTPSEPPRSPSALCRNPPTTCPGNRHSQPRPRPGRSRCGRPPRTLATSTS